VTLEQAGQRDLHPIISWAFSWTPTFGRVYVAVTVPTQQTAGVIVVPPVVEVKISDSATQTAVFKAHV